MHVKVRSLTNPAIPNLKSFDLDPEFGLACLTVDRDDVAIYLNNAPLRSWTNAKHPQVGTIKWFAEAAVIVFPKAALVSATGYHQLEAAWPTQLFLSNNYVFAGYNEEQFFTGSADHESDLVSVLSRNGEFEFCLMQYLQNDSDADNFMEVEAAYCFGDHFVFVAYDSDKLWIFGAADRKYRKIQAPFSLASIYVMSGDDKKAYAIFDKRTLIELGYEREVPPFELAVFDLVAETAAKRSFAPVETALIAAGFEPGAITLQPNAKGRIIVSDGKKAALLEFCDGD